MIMRRPAAAPIRKDSRMRAGRRALSVVVALFSLIGVVGLVVAPQATAQESAESVRGVLRFDGERIEGVTIRVTAEDGSPVGEATSDAEGEWRVAVPSPGVYEVTLDVSTLPAEIESVALETVVTDVGNTQQKVVLFRLGEPAETPAEDGGAGEDDGSAITWQRVAQLSAEGLRFGLVLALASLGLSMVFGTTGLTNFSHGELITFGAIAAWFINSAGVTLILAAVAAVALSGAFGWAQDAALWRPLRDRKTGLIAMMIVSIGFAIFLRFAFLYIFEGGRRSYAEYVFQAGIQIGPLTLAPRDLVIMAVAVVALGLSVWALSGTRLGKAMRAVADNPSLASATGIDVDRVISAVWVGGAALAGLSGVLLGLVLQVDYLLGFRTLLLVFAAVILGGLGTIWGSIIGALIVGLFIQLTSLVIPLELQTAGVLGVLIIVLLVRPQGILGRSERVG
jgi:branched-subunit amino acid ABC-type transport system permease component